MAAHLPRILQMAPTWDALLAIDETRLGHALKPLGLWQRRASSLKRLAADVVRLGGQLPRDRRALEELPGVGQYMANAFAVILSIGRAPYIDVNMARVLERHFGPRRLVDIRYDPELQHIARRIANSKHSLHVNWAVLDLAALVCTRGIPACDGCPLLRSCDHARKRGTNRVPGQRRSDAPRAYTS